jgi:chromosome partitioning protein
MRTIAVVSQKGGSGKTTVSVQLALGLWKRGRRVHLADIDPQRSSLEVLKARVTPGPQAMMSSGAKLFALQSKLSLDGVDVLIVDTPGAIEDETVQAVRLCDLAVMVLRPTYLDLAAAVNTSRMIRQLRRPGVVVLNQAPPPRDGVEAPSVKRALAALQLLQMPIAPVMLRSRAVHQTALETGRSSEEIDDRSAGARETAGLVELLSKLAFAPSLAAPPGQGFTPPAAMRPPTSPQPPLGLQVA